MRLRSPKFLLATIFALFALALNLSAPVASASGPASKSPSASSSHSSGSDHSSDSEECEDDDSDGHSSSAPVSTSSKKSISIPVKGSSSSSHDSEDGDDDEENCGTGGNGGDTPAEIAKRVPKTIGTPTIASCTADAALTWSTVVSPGYAVVDSYRVRYSSNGGTTWTTYGTTTATTSLTLTGLTAGLTYVFQVAAHNANGWGAWSASTTGCTLTATTGTVFNFILNGLEFVPVDGSGLPTFFMDYQNDSLTPTEGIVGYISRPVTAATPDSGPFINGVFDYDIYVTLPHRLGNAYTFTISGGVLSASWADSTTMLAAPGNPPHISSNFVGFYTNMETFAFSITSGTALTISINP